MLQNECLSVKKRKMDVEFDTTVTFAKRQLFSQETLYSVIELLFWQRQRALLKILQQLRIISQCHCSAVNCRVSLCMTYA